MTRHIKEKPTVRQAETGWAKARLRRGAGLRTRVAAVADASGSPAAQAGVEWNIVRGED